MPGTLIKLTNAGRAALIGPGNVGTVTRTITKIGVATAAFVHNDGLLVLPNERKKLDTFGGENVAPDMVHVTLRDDSEDQYTLYGFGLYLDNGVLLGTYSQDTPILEKSPAAMLLLSADMLFTSIDAALLQFGSASWTNPPATEARQGVVELATADETQTGTDATRAVTPAGLSSRMATEARTGLAAIASQGEANAGVDDSKMVTPKKLAVKLASYAPLASPQFSGIPNFSGGINWTNVGWRRSARFAPGEALQFDGGAKKYGVSASDTDGRLYHWVASFNDTSGPPIYYEYVNPDGTVTFPFRPSFGAATPWDTGNLNPALLAPLASPAFSGGPTVPTAAPGSNNTLIANAAFVAAAIAALVNNAPGALDTLRKLADAIGNDPNFAATVFNQIATKAPLLSPALTGSPTVPTPAQFNSSGLIANTAYVMRAIGGFAGYGTSNNGDIALSTGNANQVIFIGSNGRNVYLPSPATLPIGTTFTIANQSGATRYVYASAGTTVFNGSNGNGDSYFPLGYSDTVTLTVRDASSWVISGGSASNQFAFRNASSLNSTGYWRLPNGIILQWGGIGLPQCDGVSPAIADGAFPLAFPGGCWAFVANAMGFTLSPSSNAFVSGAPLSQSLFRVQSNYTPSNIAASWIAIGI